MDLEQFSKDRKIEERSIRKFERRTKALLIKNKYFNRVINSGNKNLNRVIGFLSPMDCALKREFANFILRNSENMNSVLEKIIECKITNRDELHELLSN